MESHPIRSPRKLIEVALPLDVISIGAQQEKNPFLKGHPRGIHLWWARRPLAAARAVAFAQLVNDPGFQQGGGFRYGKNKKDAAKERERLFQLISKLVQWENIGNESLLREARAEIERSWSEVCELNRDHPQASALFNAKKLPPLFDPFSGGGAIPLEAQRLGMRVYASDLNPVAVLINKALIEIPPKFAGKPPINPPAASKIGGASGSWPRVDGLIEDIKYYAGWLRTEAKKRIGHLYAPIRIEASGAWQRSDLKALVGREVPVIAWIWARTVKSPSPAFSHVDVPLASTFVLSTKGETNAYIKPEIDGADYTLTVKVGRVPAQAEEGTRAAARGAEFRCLLSDTPISADYIRSESESGRLGFKLMAVVADAPSGRIYLSPSQADEDLARSAIPTWQPDVEFFAPALGFRIGRYGLKRWSELFTPRQLTALSCLSDLVSEANDRIEKDARSAGWTSDQQRLENGGIGSRAYADAITTYLSCGIGHLARYSCIRCGWNKANENIAQAFGRQVINMVWDFAEANPVEGALSIEATTRWVAEALRSTPATTPSVTSQADARSVKLPETAIICTDPPYYDNIGYADLSDFFYVWLRRSLRDVLPTLFATITTPKNEELVATPARHGGRAAAQQFFLTGMTEAFANLAQIAHPSFPFVIYYAFKQSETDSSNSTSSTGWETFLAAVLKAGFQVTGTWPIRTEKTQGLKGKLNALASCIVLVCRKRPSDAISVSRREFLRELNAILPDALDEITRGAGDERSPIAPVDLSQAIIGPGMAVFSKYAAVLEADGAGMSVKTALQLINRFLAEEDFDNDTQFCLQWFQQHGWNSDVFGQADVLARAKGTSVDGVKHAGVIASGAGKVRLLKWSEYPTDWDPKEDTRLPVWEALHHFIRAHRIGGDAAAGRLVAAAKGKAEAARQLAYRLYTLCERAGWAEDARAYNELITSWPAIELAAGGSPEDQDLFGESL